MSDYGVILTSLVFIATIVILSWYYQVKKELKKKRQFRNPFTPKEGEVFTPAEYLNRVLDFKTWNRQNEVVHKSTCTDNLHHTVMIYGFCCIPHLQECIEYTLINLAGCETGIFTEPEGYRKSLPLSRQRLVELQNNIDDLSYWTRLLEETGDEFSEWIWESDPNTRPGFSLLRFVQICQKYSFEPSLTVIAFALRFTEAEVSLCWSETK